MSTTARSSRSSSSSPVSFWATSSSMESFLACRSSAVAAATRSCPRLSGPSRLVMPAEPPALTMSLRTMVSRGLARLRGDRLGKRGPALDLVGDLAEGDRVVDCEPAGGHPAAVDAGAVGAAEVPHLDRVAPRRQLGVAPGDGGVVDGDVRRDTPSDDHTPPGRELEALVAGGADEAERGHEEKIAGQGRVCRYVTLNAVKGAMPAWPPSLRSG